MPKKLKTPNQGANAERTAILAHLRRERRALRKSYGAHASGMCTLDSLIDWVSERSERSSKRAGGLGRR